MDKETVVCIHNRILLGHEKETESFEEKWMHLEAIMLSKNKSDTEG